MIEGQGEGTVVLIAAAPAGRGRIVDATSVLPALAAVPPGALAGTRVATVVELADPVEPQTVLTRLRGAATGAGRLAVYLAGQLHLDHRQSLPHLALARTSTATLRYTALPWHWLADAVKERRPGTTTVVADLVADAATWRALEQHPELLELPPGTELYGRVAPPPGRRAPRPTPDYLRAYATIWRAGARPTFASLHAQATARTQAGQAILLERGYEARVFGGLGDERGVDDRGASDRRAGVGVEFDAPVGDRRAVAGAEFDASVGEQRADVDPEFDASVGDRPAAAGPEFDRPSVVPPQLDTEPVVPPVVDPAPVVRPVVDPVPVVPPVVAPAPVVPTRVAAGPVVPPVVAPAPGARPEVDPVPVVGTAFDPPAVVRLPSEPPALERQEPADFRAAEERAYAAGTEEYPLPRSLGEGDAEAGSREAEPAEPTARDVADASASERYEAGREAPVEVGESDSDPQGPADAGPAEFPVPRSLAETDRQPAATGREPQGAAEPVEVDGEDARPAALPEAWKAGADRTRASEPPAEGVAERARALPEADSRVPERPTASPSPAEGAPGVREAAVSVPERPAGPPRMAEMPAVLPEAATTLPVTGVPERQEVPPAPEAPQVAPEAPVRTTRAPDARDVGSRGAWGRVRAVARGWRGSAEAPAPVGDVVAPGQGDPHPGILAAAQAGRHTEAAAAAAAWELDALRRYGAGSGEAIHWLEVRADLARLADEPARSCELWIAAARARIGQRQDLSHPDVEGAVDRAHHQWEQVRDEAKARALAPELVELRRQVPGRRAGALQAIQRRLDRFQRKDPA